MIQGEGFAVIKYFVMSCKMYIKEAIRVVEKRMVHFNLSYLSMRKHGKDTTSSPQPKALDVKSQQWVVRMKSLYIKTLLGC